VSRLDKIAAIAAEAEEELQALRLGHDKQRVEIHQLRNRLQREQDQVRELQDRVADLELRLAQEQEHAKNATAATLAHVARTS
jgi:uncharacterized protein YlxW (UPF0749 family)